MSTINMKPYDAGAYREENDYRYFLPTHINSTWKWNDPELNVLLEYASSELGSLNAFSELIPNIDLYISMHIATEANKSNRIEGTNTSIEEDFMAAEDLSPEKRNDKVEVQNYIKAMHHGIYRITRDDFPLCNRLLRELHEILLQGVRGEHKTPGEWRNSQNWIGGTKPSDAVFVPPSHIHLPDLLSDWEKFLNNEDCNVPHLIKVAILHYQFETIHPFLDGNGRLGRLMIPLYMLDKHLLSRPCFYISDYLEKHRTEYYDALTRVRTNGDMLSWVKFFMNSIVFTAQSAKNKFKKVTEYVKTIEEVALTLGGRSENTISVIRSFYNNPVQTAKQLAETTKLSRGTVENTLRRLLENNILQEITGYSRNRVYVLYKYLHIFM